MTGFPGPSVGREPALLPGLVPNGARQGLWPRHQFRTLDAARPRNWSTATFASSVVVLAPAQAIAPACPPPVVAPCGDIAPGSSPVQGRWADKHRERTSSGGVPGPKADAKAETRQGSSGVAKRDHAALPAQLRWFRVHARLRAFSAAGGIRPGVNAGFRGQFCLIADFPCCHARLRASCPRGGREAGKRA